MSKPLLLSAFALLVILNLGYASNAPELTKTNRSEIEPRLSKAESLIIREAIAKRENQLDEAIAYLEENLDEDSSAALDFALGTMFYQSNRLTRSSQSYAQAIKKFPSFLRAHKNLGLVNLSLGNWQLATDHLARAISLGDNDGSTFIKLGYCHLSLGRLVSAENAYRKGLLLLPESRDGLNGLITCLKQAGKYDEALNLLKELLESNPENSRYLQERASALVIARYEEAYNGHGSLGKEKEAPAFKSKLFESGNLLISDDFDQGKYKGRYGPNKKNIKQLADGTLEVLPLSGTPGDLTIFHIYNVPSKFICHFRYKQVCSSSDAGAGIQIGGHKMHLGCTGDGYSLFLRNAGKTYKNSEVEDFKANQWIDMIIEYQQGKMLLNINGNETIFEHEGVNMDGAKSIVFKYRNIDRTLFDYVRLWEVTE